jgi:hypothetical protein
MRSCDSGKRKTLKGIKHVLQVPMEGPQQCKGKEVAMTTRDF